MDIEDAQKCLDKIISKGKSHFYKPIQIAEILHRHRTSNEVDLDDLESYRTQSKSWRDSISKTLIGNVCTSSSRFQDNLFDDNAMPPNAIKTLALHNKVNNGEVEVKIYRKLKEKFAAAFEAFSYCSPESPTEFSPTEFIDLFKGGSLKGSTGKAYEILTFSLIQSVTFHLQPQIKMTLDSQRTGILNLLPRFQEMVLGGNSENLTYSTTARFTRVGISNAADKGIDIYSNFGVSVQVKHEPLTKKLITSILSQNGMENIVVSCIENKIQDDFVAEPTIDTNLQSIVCLLDLENWYAAIFASSEYSQLASSLLALIKEHLILEFPLIDSEHNFDPFCKNRNYQI